MLKINLSSMNKDSEGKHNSGYVREKGPWAMKRSVCFTSKATLRVQCASLENSELTQRVFKFKNKEQFMLIGNHNKQLFLGIG